MGCDCGHDVECDGAADRERANMIRTGRAILYACPTYVSSTSIVWHVTDWTGRLSFPAVVKRGRHNLGRTRMDLWFTGPDSLRWHGIQIGEFNQLARCRRLGPRAQAWGRRVGLSAPCRETGR